MSKKMQSVFDYLQGCLVASVMTVAIIQLYAQSIGVELLGFATVALIVLLLWWWLGEKGKPTAEGSFYGLTGLVLLALVVIASASGASLNWVAIPAVIVVAGVVGIVMNLIQVHRNAEP